MRGAIHHAPPNRIPENNAITGSLAPHGTNVAVMIVSLLSLSFSIVFDAMMPGIPHPEEISSGMKLLPERPNLLNTLSSTNAIRTMYPQSSSTDSRMKSISICGRKPNIAPANNTVNNKACKYIAYSCIFHN